jgi:pilus assembly protein CpaC
MMNRAPTPAQVSRATRAPGGLRMPAFISIRSHRSCWSGLLAALLCVVTGNCVRAQDPPVDIRSEEVKPDANAERSFEGVKIVSNKMTVDLTERFSKVLEFRERLLRVDGHDPQVIHVSPLEPNKLRVQGVSQGVTTMVVTDSKKQTWVIEVYVSGDARLLQSVLKRAFPDSAIEAKALKGDTVLLTGYVTDNQTITQIMDVARAYAPEVINHMKVGGPQEVQLRVKIIEVQRSKLRTFGVNFKALTSNSVIASTPGPISPISNLINPLGGAPSLTLTPSTSNAPSLTAGFSGNHFAFDMFIQALKEEGLLKVMTEPVLVTRSGEAARLSDGGEFPIPVPGGLGTVTIEFREFGVILQTLPIVLSPTRVKQQVSAEVSEKDVSNAITLNGTTVPGITKRKVESTVDMNFGDTMVIGGLISTRTVGSTFKTPFLGELPLIGAAFRKESYQSSETELIILITPEYGSSMPADQIPPGGPGTLTAAPTDRELYGDGLLEVPKFGPDCGPECNVHPSGRYHGECLTPGSPTSPGPTIPSSPTYSPTPSGLIAPQGVETPGSNQPPPSPDGSISKRGSSRTPWPARSKIPTSTKSKDPEVVTDSSGIHPVGYKKTAKTEPPARKTSPNNNTEGQK